MRFDTKNDRLIAKRKTDPEGWACDVHAAVAATRSYSEAARELRISRACMADWVKELGLPSRAGKNHKEPAK